MAYLESLIERLPLIPSSVETSISPAKQTNLTSSKKIFIVHGHDITSRAEVELLIKKLVMNQLFYLNRQVVARLL